MKTRKETITRLHVMMSILSMEYMDNLSKAEEEQKACEEAKKSGELKITVLTGDWNAKVMMDCMKETRKAIEYMKNDDNDIEEWQLAGINAMFDTVNATGNLPFDLPTAICGILGTDY